MAQNAGSVQMTLGVNAKGFTSGMASASQSVNNFVQNIQHAGQKTSSFQKTLIGVGAAVGVAGYALTKFARQSFSVAAGVAEMNVAMDAVGKSTGIGGKVIKDTAKEIRSMGIEMQASQEIAMLFVKGNIELSKASQVARVAQDLAVLSQSNSTDTARTLTYAIQTGNSMLLKSAGITKYASEAYAMYARELKVTESSLTATQRQMAITNMILKEGAKVAGVYEAAMREPGKVLRSFPRLLNDIQLEFGNLFLKGFGPVILAAYKFTDAFSKSIREGGALAPVLKSIQDAIAKMLKPMADAIKNFTMMYQRIPNVTAKIQAMSKSVQKLAPALFAGSTALSLFAGKNLLSMLPIVGRFTQSIGAGGPLLTGLAILVAMSPKLRMVFMDVADSMKPLIPAFLEVGRISAEVVTYLVTAFENIATALQGSLTTTVEGLAIAFLGIAKTVLPLVIHLAKLVEFVTRSETAIQMFSAVLLTKVVVGFLATNKAMVAFRVNMVGLVAQTKVMQFQFATTFNTMRALGVSTFASLRIASTSTFATMVAGARTAGAAIAASLGPYILVAVAVFALMKVFTAFSNRNKDVEETTKNLSKAVSEQIKILKGDEYAIASFIGSAKELDGVLLKAEDSGDKLSASLMILTGSTSGASEILGKMQSDSAGLTQQLGAQTIGTDALAQKTIDYLNRIDKISPKEMEEALRLMYVGTQKLTEGQIQAALALEELQDQSENTDFKAMIGSTAKAAMETSKYGVKAVKTADELLLLEKQQNKTMSEYDQYVFYTKALSESMTKLAKEAGEVDTALDPAKEHNYATAIGELNKKLEEGEVSMDMYKQALFGNFDAQNKFSESMHDTNKEFGDLLDGLKNAKGSSIKLKDAGFALTDQMAKYQKILNENNGTAADSLAMQKSVAKQFEESAIKAGYSAEAVKGVIEALGIYKSMEGLEKNLTLNLDQAIKAFDAYIKMYTTTQILRQSDKEDSQLNQLYKALAVAKAAAKITKEGFLEDINYKPISDATKGAAKDTATFKQATEALTDRIKSQKRAVIEAKQALQDYARSSTASMYKAVSVGSVFNRFQQKRSENDAILERNKQISAQKEADRVAKERRSAELLIDSKNKLIDVENELTSLQNEFSISVGGSVSEVLSFSNVLGIQENAVASLASAREQQAQAESDLAEKTSARVVALAEVSRLEGQISLTSGRYLKRVLGEKLVEAQENATKATLEFAEAQEIARLATEQTNKVGAQQITFLQGLEEQAKKSLDFAKVIEKLTDVGLSQDALSQIASAGADAGTIMGNELMAGGADAITKANKFVKTIIDEGQRVANKFSKSLKDRLEYAVYEDEPVYEELGKEVGETFAQSLVAQSKKAKAFSDKVKQLISMGLRGTQLEEVLNAGVDAGTDIADALIASGAGTIQESVAIQDELKNLSKKFGDELVPYFDQTGIMLADALLSALQNKLKNLDQILENKSGKEINDFIEGLDNTIADEARVIADTLVGTPANTVIDTGTMVDGYNFTAKDLEDLGRIGRGDFAGVLGLEGINHAAIQAELDAMLANFSFGVPAFAKGGIVTAPMLGMVGEAGSEAIIPLSKLGAMGGSTYNISVSAGMGADGSSIGAQIVEQIKRYEKSNGKRWRS
jgi:hypothetical protein